MEKCRKLNQSSQEDEEVIFQPSGSCNELQLGDMVQPSSKDTFEFVWGECLFTLGDH